jgi:hypothetical protein
MVLEYLAHNPKKHLPQHPYLTEYIVINFINIRGVSGNIVCLDGISARNHARFFIFALWA